ncbi:NAD(P)-binding protein [Auricularia subglabra TFB-10046 SS5]|nr:NAD(P)-binding protein [Auricularia subglabra TFB-10046 SS5]
MPAISPPATVLVTGEFARSYWAFQCLLTHCPGVTGFVAAHVAHNYLQQGFSVRGTVRSAAKAEYLRALFEEKFPGKFEIVAADLNDADSLDCAAEGIDGIAHVATPGTLDLPLGSNPKVVIDPTVNSTISILNAAAKSGTVKRVVITGTIGTIRHPQEAPYTYSTRDWNDAAEGQLAQLGNQAPAVLIYYVSKLRAERAAYKWIEENKPSFDLSHVLPGWVFGPVFNQAKSLADVTHTPRVLLDYFLHPKSGKELATSLGPCIHVHDVARAHVDAHTNEKLGNNSRLILASGHEIAFQEYYDAYWSLPESERPKLPIEVTKGDPGALKGIVPIRWETAEEALGWSFRPLPVIVRDTLNDIAQKIYKA